MILQHVSASQVDLFRRCQRSWFNRSILKIPVPPSAAQSEGKDIHAAIEDYLKTGKILPGPHAARVRAAADRYLPDVPGDHLVEHEIRMPIFASSGPEWLGYIDLVDRSGKIWSIVDHKTTSDFRWAKTPEDLKTDVQMMAYAHWAILTGHLDRVELIHGYVHTRKDSALAVSTVVGREEIESFWDGLVNTVADMVTVAGAGHQNAEEHLPAARDPGECSKYRGCPHRQLCGLEPMEGRFKMTGSGSKLMDRLAKKSVEAGLTPPVQETPPAQDTTAPESPLESAPIEATGVLPPDAPTRETPQPAPAEAAPPKRRGRPRKSEIEKAHGPEIAAKVEDATEKLAAVLAEDVKAAIEAVVTAPHVADLKTKLEQKIDAEKTGLRLYVDCWPVKGETAPTLFEDWIAPIAAKAAATGEVQDYRLIKYNAAPALALAVRDAVLAGNCPDVLVVSSFTKGADVALEVLVPRAARVVRALRG